MSRSAAQLRIFDALWTELRPHIATDRNLPARIQQRLAKEKRFGSRDRRLYRELLYTALRYLPWLENMEPESSVRGAHASRVLVLASRQNLLSGETPDKARETRALPEPNLPKQIIKSHLMFETVAQATLWLSPDTPATLPLKRDLLAAAPPCPATITERAVLLGQSPDALLPAWFRAHCPAAFAEPNLTALHTRAPLWLRLQTTDPAPVFAEFAARGWTWRHPSGTGCQPVIPTTPKPTGWQPVPLPTDALELHAPNDPDLSQTDAYRRGHIEIQDLGSQLILPLALSSFSPSALQSFSLFLDACAGAGGKTLQLARLLGPDAQIDATDPRPAALAELRARAARAGLKNIRIISQNTLAQETTPAQGAAVSRPPDATKSRRFAASEGEPLRASSGGLETAAPSHAPNYDGILVDAPCSGTGTWRRNPHLKYCTPETAIHAAAKLQLEILARHAPLVRPDGGLLIYATCSLSRIENENVIETFLAAPAHRDFSLIRQTTILPAEHNTDGFFTATLRRN